MRKLLSLIFVVLLVLGFVVGALQSTASASLPCTAACINGQLRVCCYNAQHVYTCNWLGPCFGD
jgi:hypothetical protein